MLFARGLLLSFLLLFFTLRSWSQRSYANSSVLASGNWYKISTDRPGVYKIDLPFLQSLGIPVSNLSSGSIRIYGNGGGMLPEANNGPWTDDLQQIAIQVEDGGDGILNGSDHILFYSDGPHKWNKDSVNLRFDHQLNLYSDVSYYFITIQPGGKRVATVPASGSGAIQVTQFSGRYYYELDTFNFLSSGKEWYGEEFSGAPGKTLTRQFSLPLQQVTAGSTLEVRSSLLARAVGNASVFHINLNNQLLGQPLLPPVSGGLYNPVATEQVFLNTGITHQANQLEFIFTPGSFNAQGWLNWFEIFYRGRLSMNGADQLLFRDWLSVGAGNAEFIIEGASTATRVWDITDPSGPQNITGNFSAGNFLFVHDVSRLREYVAFNPNNYLKPGVIGKIVQQNLHQTTAADLIIVCPPAFREEALRLAQLHQQHDTLRSVVATTEEIFNEFGSGSPDPTAIRDFVKMYYDRYGSDPQNRPRYLLLFGDASYDYRGKKFSNNLLVPSYQNRFSLDPLNSYVSDDFFGFLDDQEDIGSGVVLNLLDLGIGRVPAGTVEEARQFVDKLSRYLSPSALGPWRTQTVFVADDEDNNLHLQDADAIALTAASTNPVYNQSKIYMDAYFQESGAGGERYPQANQAINNQVINGTLIWNFNGHGGPARLAEETILDQEIVDHWSNDPRLPLFITATCDFAPFDNPAINSIGENILLRREDGAIGLMTTTRLVFAFSNRVMNENYMRIAMEADASGRHRSLGDAVKDAKNFTYQNFTDITNNRKFTLLGDPALTLGFPRNNIRITRVNQLPPAMTDTLSAGEEIMIEGEITDQAGNLLPGFNGTVYPSIFDKSRTIQTRGNDPGSPVTSFQSQQNILFRGKATVSQGRFNFRFKVPRDINLAFGNGKISVYAENSETDAAGRFDNIVVGGSSTLGSNDDMGPEIKAYLNDEMFVNGGTVNETPILIVKLSDSSGINTTGLGIGHDLVATLDYDNRQYFILNDFYQAEMDDYTKGTVNFQLPALSPGLHTLQIKAWDGMNNSNEISLEFVVAADEELVISHVLNYPNPFTSSTEFWFEHNKPGIPLQVQLQVMTITGRIVKTFSGNVVTTGNRFAGFNWDGRDDFGNRLGRGTYLYLLRVTAPNGLKKQQLEKLVIL